jgi:citryl-CoA lyase
MEDNMSDNLDLNLPEWSTAISEVGFHKINIRGYPLPDIIRNLTFSQVVFLTIRGELPTKEQSRVMDAVLCGITDHGLFAPTPIAGRVIGSATPESIMPGIAGAMLTVGSMTVSPQDTADLILYALNTKKNQGLSDEDTAKQVVDEMLAKKKRFPGLGHPLHPTGDPRAIALKEVAVANGVWGDKAKLYETMRKTFIQARGKDFPINIDGMMGCVLTELGFQPKEMAGIAALSFMPGIIAHVVEELQVPRMRVIPGKYTGVAERKLPVEKS